MRKIIHIDLDAFFASIEQRDRPEYRGKPVLVGGAPQRRGVVSTCSYEAREYGIHSAMPTRTALRLCPHRRSYERGIALPAPLLISRHRGLIPTIGGFLPQKADFVKKHTLSW